MYPPNILFRHTQVRHSDPWQRAETAAARGGREVDRRCCLYPNARPGREGGRGCSGVAPHDVHTSRRFAGHHQALGAARHQALILLSLPEAVSRRATPPAVPAVGGVEPITRMGA